MADYIDTDGNFDNNKTFFFQVHAIPHPGRGIFRNLPGFPDHLHPVRDERVLRREPAHVQQRKVLLGCEGRRREKTGQVIFS